MFTNYDEHHDIIAQLKQQNSWLEGVEFDFVRENTVNTADGKYTNAIISCDLLVQALFLKHRSTICSAETIISVLIVSPQTKRVPTTTSNIEPPKSVASPLRVERINALKQFYAKIKNSQKTNFKHQSGNR